VCDQVDHFFWFDVDEIMRGKDNAVAAQISSNSSSSSFPIPFALPISTLALDKELKDEYQALKRVSKLDLDDFAIVHVAPSVIPTYYPAIRVWTYNVSNPEDRYRPKEEPILLAATTLESLEDDDSDDDDYRGELAEEEESLHAFLFDDLVLQRPHSSIDTTLYSEDELYVYVDETWEDERSERMGKGGGNKNKKKKKKRKKKKRKKKKPKKPRHASPDSPSRTNRFLTPLSYTQFFLDLDEANRNDGWGRHGHGNLSAEAKERPPFPEWKVEYTTSKPLPLPPSPAGGEEASSDKAPRDRWTSYGLPDLTIPRWLGLARKLAKRKAEWKVYARHMYVSSGAEGTETILDS
jgi:endopolyphosphatase